MVAITRTHCLPDISTQQLQTLNIRVILLGQLDDDFTLLTTVFIEVEVDDVDGGCIVRSKMHQPFLYRAMKFNSSWHTLSIVD